MNPNEATLATIAHQLIENRTTENVQFWIVYGALFTVFSIVVAIATSYLMERGKLLAATNTLATRLDEIRKSTEASERVKVQIAHNDWTVKELRTLRRTKLEQLTSNTYRLIADTQKDAKLPDSKSEFHLDFLSEASLIEIEQIALLYFPEFSAQVDLIVRSYRETFKWILVNRMELIKREKEVVITKESIEAAILNPAPYVDPDGERIDAYTKANEALVEMRKIYATGYAERRDQLRSAVGVLHGEAKALMGALITPTV